MTEQVIDLDAEQFEQDPSSANPLLGSLLGQPSPSQNLWHKFRAFLSSNAAQRMLPPEPHTVFTAVQVPNTPVTTPGQPSVITVERGGGNMRCGCCAVTILMIIGIVTAFIAFGMYASKNHEWATIEKLGTTFTSYVFHEAHLASHHTFVAYFDAYNDTPRDDDLRLERMSGPKSVARIAGSFDFASLRLDWNFVVVDAHHALGPRLSATLWMQHYNKTTHLMDHVPHSPFTLCVNHIVNETCVGHTDQPLLDVPALSGDDLDPALLALALYRGNVTTGDPLWLIPLDV
jgi:hypothetical protein